MSLRVGPVSRSHTTPAVARASAAPTSAGFADIVARAVRRLAELQERADLAAQRVATGDLGRLEEAVIAMQEASLAVDLVVAVRNHLVEGIHELLRTQV